MMKGLLLMLLLTPSLIFAACPAGTTPFKDTCVVEIEPYQAQAVKPSDESPPSEKMPSYQRPDVVLINAPSTAAEDERLDREKADADREGKQAAGIRTRK